jgi:23S rRNA (adenine-N6)-dimethyltransferase
VPRRTRFPHHQHRHPHPQPGRHEPGRHELGQNFLVDRRTIDRVVALVAATRGPILELGPGDGALTQPLTRLGRPITAVELDPRRARRLGERGLPRVDVVHGDATRRRHPPHPHVVVGNVPFHVTTAILRHVLEQEHWTDAVLLVQWEVARRRAGVGGATLLTASWLPWFDFRLEGRVPRHAFRPVPNVDGGLLAISRRQHPAVRDRRGYQRLAARVFAAPGRRIDRRLAAAGVPASAVAAWMRTAGVRASAEPKDLPLDAWIALWRATGGR